MNPVPNDVGDFSDRRQPETKQQSLRTVHKRWACFQKISPKAIGALTVATLIGVVAAAVSAQQYDASSGSSLAAMKVPLDNPLNASKIELGKKLFFDTRLSADGTVACATCHDPKHSFSNSHALSVGVFGRLTQRHAPALLGRGFGNSEFWDGRAGTLEEQVVQPILNRNEMDNSVASVLERLNHLNGDTSYRGLTQDSLVRALASYVRTLRSEDSPYDRFLSGRPHGLSEFERQGLLLFRDKARCYICHSGGQLTDEGYHNTGVAWVDGTLRDEGRAAITGKNYHKGAFKTPTLREVGKRGPFMHDGSLATLEDVVEFYDRGGNANPHLDENIVPLHLSREEKASLVAFLRKGLSGLILEGMENHPFPAEPPKPAKTPAKNYRDAAHMDDCC
ncbi:MAG TPA: cytochrome c peroxidase [Candidatus Angelobacter sp.]|nr:cytochrome c peroxidase [Candidatus Angelobacter sp.]